MKSLFDQMVSSGGLDSFLQWYNEIAARGMENALDRLDREGFSPELLNLVQSYVDAFYTNLAAVFGNTAFGELMAGEIGTPWDGLYRQLEESQTAYSKIQGLLDDMGSKSLGVSGLSGNLSWAGYNT